MKKKLFISLSIFAVLANFYACRQWNKLVGKDDKENSSPAAAPDNSSPPPTAAPPIAVPPVAGRFDVFTDAGGVTNDPASGIVTDGTIHYDFITSTEAQEGTRYIHCHVEEDHAGGHIKFSFDKNNTGRTVDLSAFTAVSFFLRLDRNHLPADNCNVYFEDGDGHGKDIELRNLPGININSTSWQRLQLPVSALSGLNLAKMKVGFGIHPLAADPQATGPHIDLDGIVWTH